MLLPYEATHKRHPPIEYFLRIRVCATHKSLISRSSLKLLIRDSFSIRSESSRGSFWIAKDVTLLHVDNEDSDQATRMRMLIGICA